MTEKRVIYPSSESTLDTVWGRLYAKSLYLTTSYFVFSVAVFIYGFSLFARDGIVNLISPFFLLGLLGFVFGSRRYFDEIVCAAIEGQQLKLRKWQKEYTFGQDEIDSVKLSPYSSITITTQADQTFYFGFLSPYKSWRMFRPMKPKKARAYDEVEEFLREETEAEITEAGWWSW